MDMLWILRPGLYARNARARYHEELARRKVEDREKGERARNKRAVKEKICELKEKKRKVSAEAQLIDDEIQALQAK